jgi:hypothetical protein
MGQDIEIATASLPGPFLQAALRKLLGDRLFYRRTLGDPPPVLDDRRKSSRVYAIVLDPLRQREKVRVANRVAFAHYPWPLDHLSLDQLVTAADGLWDLSLHGGDGSRIIRPSIAAHPMRVRDVHGRADEAVECLHLGEGKGIVERRETSLRKALRDECEYGRRLGEDAPRRRHRGHAPFCIDGKIVRLPLLGAGKVNALELIGCAGLEQSYMGSKRAAMRSRV